MTQPWIRSYRGALHNPKIQRMPPPLFKAWQNFLWCTDDDGVLPSVADVAFILRASEKQVRGWLVELTARGLFDDIGGGLFQAHDWSEHQKKSDTSNERVKQHRERKKAVTCNVTGNDTREDTEQTREEQTQEQSAGARNFDAAWKAYPHPGNASRALAEQAWDQLGDELPPIAQLMVAIDLYRGWLNAETKRRPPHDPPPIMHFANWLKERRFESFLGSAEQDAERAAEADRKRFEGMPACWRGCAEVYVEAHGAEAWDHAVANAKLKESDAGPVIEFDRPWSLNFAREQGWLERIARALGHEPSVTVRGGKPPKAA